MQKATSQIEINKILTEYFKKMYRENIIVIHPCTLTTEAYGNFKKMCEAKGFPYHSLKMLKFPITYKDVIIYKTEFK